MPALDSIEVQGYKSIRSAKIELGAINVLIGANGAGKSNLLGLFGLLADLAERRLQFHVARQGGADAILHFGSKRTSSLSISVQFGLRGYEVVLVPGADDRLVIEREEPFNREPARVGLTRRSESAFVPGVLESGLREPLWEWQPSQTPDHLEGYPVLVRMQSWRPFHFHDSGKSAPVKRKHKIDDNRVLRAEGDNLAAVLLGLQTIAPGSYRRIVESVRSVAPYFDDFSLAPDLVNPDVIQLAWRHRNDDALFTADSLSDGTLRFICLATLLLQPELPSLIVIDEPELGLHPFAIAQLVALIRSAATKTQVLLATQSVTLLDQFDFNEVIVTECNEGESGFERLNDNALAEWKQEYSLGELWLKNVLGGRPR